MTTLAKSRGFNTHHDKFDIPDSRHLFLSLTSWASAIPRAYSCIGLLRSSSVCALNTSILPFNCIRSMIAAIMRGQPMPLFTPFCHVPVSCRSHLSPFYNRSRHLHITTTRKLKTRRLGGQKFLLEHRICGFDSTNFRVTGIPCRHCEVLNTQSIVYTNNYSPGLYSPHLPSLLSRK